MTGETAAAEADGEKTATPVPGDAAPAEADKEGTAASPENDGDGSAAEGSEGEGEANPQPKKSKGGFQRRIDELRRREADAQRDRDHWRDLAMKNAGVQPASDVRAPLSSDTPPKQEDFPNYDDFVAAKARHEVRQELRAEERRRREAEHTERATERREAFTKRCDEASERYEDFEEVAFNRSLPITDAMAEVIQESDKGPDLAYYLGSHPDEAKRIAGLSPLAQARELGRIETTLSKPAPRKTTSAPDPVKTVSGKDAPTKDPSKMSMDEYVAARNAGKIK